MPWCPECGTIYTAWIEFCAACGSVLAFASLEEIALTDGPDWVLLDRPSTLTQAKYIYLTLKDNEFSVILRDRLITPDNMFGLLSKLQPVFEIYVPAGRKEEARELVKDEVEWSERELIEYMKLEGEINPRDDDNWKYLNSSIGGFCHAMVPEMWSGISRRRRGLLDLQSTP